MVHPSFEEVLQDVVAREDGARSRAKLHPSIWQKPMQHADSQFHSTSIMEAVKGYADNLADEMSVTKVLLLSDALSIPELQSIRRRFALICHPDRVDPSMRPAALRQMQVVNGLIDQALAERRAGATSASL
jgi:hypothetical protein